MQEKLNKVKAYLYKMLETKKFTSFVFEKHPLIDKWIYLHIAIDETRSCKVFISESGVITFEGEGSYLTLEIMNAINLICEPDYYKGLFDQIANNTKEID